MATYKKRGYKPKKVKPEVEEDISDIEVLEENSTTAEVFNTLDEGATKTEEWVAANQNIILGVLGAVALLVIGYIGYNKFIAEPKEEEASNEMFKAQQYFNQAVEAEAEAKDSLYTLSLSGGEGKFGFEEIIDNYGGTKAANLAKYYAGFAYLHTGNYQEAINKLDDFSSDDEILYPIAQGGIGDAFSQLGQMEQALSYYEKAASSRENNFTTPKYLFKAGMTALETGDKDKALQHFTKIKEDYGTSEEAQNIDLYIGQAETI